MLDELHCVNSAQNHRFDVCFIHIFKVRFPNIKTNIKTKIITLQIKFKLEKRGKTGQPSFSWVSNPNQF